MIKEAKELIGSFKKNPRTASLIIIVSVILIAFFAYLMGFFGEKGKQHANTPSKSGEASPATQAKPSPNSTTAPQIHQHTEGSQSPAVVSKDSHITYGSPKSNKKD